MLQLLPLSLLLYASVSRAIEDNEVVGIPHVRCLPSVIEVTFNTRERFTGRIFVQGSEKIRDCVLDVPNQLAVATRFLLDLSSDPCGVSGSPVPGVSGHLLFSVILVVSFSSAPASERAFRASCLFPESLRLASSYALRPPVDEKLLEPPPPPTPDCAYTVRSGSPDGPVLSASQVGQRVFHVWECTGAPGRGFLVRSCYATDGAGAKIRLYDQRGCAVDPLVMPDIRYSVGLGRAHAETHGFKFSDVSFLNIECLLQFCRIDKAECLGMVPPRCSGLYKRSPLPGTPFVTNDPASPHPHLTKVSVHHRIVGSQVHETDSKSPSPETLCLAQDFIINCFLVFVIALLAFMFAVRRLLRAP